MAKAGKGGADIELQPLGQLDLPETKTEFRLYGSSFVSNWLLIWPFFLAAELRKKSASALKLVLNTSERARPNGALFEDRWKEEAVDPKKCVLPAHAAPSPALSDLSGWLRRRLLCC
jgi:hypothetical protein